MLSLTKRPCQIGTSINTRRELHGDEPVPAVDIPILGVTLDANELNSLLEEPTAYRALFNTTRGTEQPLFPQLEPFELKDKIEGASVTLKLGRREVEFKSCKLKGLTLKPMSGGVTLLSFKVQTSAEDIAKSVGDLVDAMDRTIEISVGGGELVKDKASAQQDLPINTFGDGEEVENSSIGRQVQHAARKAARKERRGKNGHTTPAH